VRANPAARQLIEARLPQVRQRPEAIEAVLVDLLAGPCAQPGEAGQRPLLLIIPYTPPDSCPRIKSNGGTHRTNDCYASFTRHSP